MTYNVFGGTLNLALSIYLSLKNVGYTLNLPSVVRNTYLYFAESTVVILRIEQTNL